MPSYQTLIDAAQLQTLQQAGAPLVVLDCGFDLADPGAGEAAYAASHVAGAFYAHLDRDLSASKTGRNGRHPLPARAMFAARMGAWGITPATQVVTYDRQGGPYAARAWWMLRWMGHAAVAVLDGGFAAWAVAAAATESGRRAAASAPDYALSAEPAMPTVDAQTLLGQLGRVRVLDARNAERFRGEVEPLDAVAGHIPGATLRFFKDNLRGDGSFKSADTLRREFEAFATEPSKIVHQCGSGVTACHNLLAMAHAGLEGSTLYPGSWSEWCADPARPVAVG